MLRVEAQGVPVGVDGRRRAAESAVGGAQGEPGVGAFRFGLDPAPAPGEQPGPVAAQLEGHGPLLPVRFLVRRRWQTLPGVEGEGTGHRPDQPVVALPLQGEEPHQPGPAVEQSATVRARGDRGRGHDRGGPAVARTDDLARGRGRLEPAWPAHRVHRSPLSQPDHLRPGRRTDGVRRFKQAEIACPVRRDQRGGRAPSLQTDPPGRGVVDAAAAGHDPAGGQDHAAARAGRRAAGIKGAHRHHRALHPVEQLIRGQGRRR